MFLLDPISHQVLIQYLSQSIYRAENPVEVSDNPTRPAFVPVCQTSPLCSTKLCDTSLSLKERIASLVSSLTEEEKILNLVNSAAGAPRIGLPLYEWWNEALHGLGFAPGVHFREEGEFSFSTQFPSPILIGAAFDDDLVARVARVIGKEARAFANAHFTGFEFWTPNINTFRDPRWGRGQETPGEDAFHAQQYVKQFIPGLQGPDKENKQVIATCKHYAAYDLETGRYGNNYNPNAQDLADYYLAPFKTCVRDIDVGSVMCAYNAVNGVPSCASEYLLQEVLREHWKFDDDFNYVVGDCGAVSYIANEHNFTNSLADGAAIALNAGTDLDCGFGQGFTSLNQSLADGSTTIEKVDQALIRLYSALATVGYFDGSRYSTTNWRDVATKQAQDLAYEAAVSGMTLLKNDGTLPLDKTPPGAIAGLFGPYANATRLLQGNYFGTADHIISAQEAFQQKWRSIYLQGSAISGNSTANFNATIEAAKTTDVIFFFGGIDNSIETEGLDRADIAWPQIQLDLISQLSQLGKPLIVVQFGGGQVDDTPLLRNENVNAILWAGYPGQSGGKAILDVVTGKKSVAGRLPITQYPAQYAEDVSIFDISLRPTGNTPFPGRTYKWYNGEAVLPFGYGLHYTTFSAALGRTLKSNYDIASLPQGNDATRFSSLSVRVTNTGQRASDYAGLLFLSSTNAGPNPRPIKSLVSYGRLKDIRPGQARELNLELSLGSLARADEAGNLVVYPGDYTLALDDDARVTFNFTLTGEQRIIDTLPSYGQYNYTVPVNIAAPSNRSYDGLVPGQRGG